MTKQTQTQAADQVVTDEQLEALNGGAFDYRDVSWIIGTGVNTIDDAVGGGH